MIKKALAFVSLLSGVAFGFTPQLYIQSTNSLQAGATFYVSSGTAVQMNAVDIRTASPMADIRYYGAISDPSGATDSAGAIQAAINVSSSVYIPCGTFFIGTGLTVINRSNFMISGAGPCSIIKQKASTALTTLTISTSTDLVLQNFVVDGNYGSQAQNGTSAGIIVNGTSSRVTEQNLIMQGIDGNMLQFNNPFDPSSSHDNAILNCTLKNEGTIQGGGIKIQNPQSEMRIIGNRVFTGGTGEAAQIEISSSVVADNVFISTASIAVTLNGGQSYGETGQNVFTGNYLLGHDISLELGNFDGLTTVTGNHIEQELCKASCVAVSFTGAGVDVSSDVVFSGNVIVASHTLVGFGNDPIQVTWTGNLFSRSNPNDTSNWFSGTPSLQTFMGNFFDGENMTASYNIFSQQIANSSMIGNIFNCGPSSTSNAIQPASLGSNLSTVYMGNRFTNCTNNFVNGAFDYQIGDSLQAIGNGSFNFAATTNWADGTLSGVTLTPGTWMLSATAGANLNGATMTGFSVGISSTSGNSAAGMTEGRNWLDFPPATTTPSGGSVPQWIVTVPASGSNPTYNVKVKAVYSAGTPQVIDDRITAVRIQ